MTKMDIRSWSWWPGLQVGQHYKVTMSALSQVGTFPDMTVDVASRSDNNKQQNTGATFVMIFTSVLCLWLLVAQGKVAHPGPAISITGSQQDACELLLSSYLQKQEKSKVSSNFVGFNV